MEFASQKSEAELKHFYHQLQQTVKFINTHGTQMINDCYLWPVAKRRHMHQQSRNLQKKSLINTFNLTLKKSFGTSRS